MTKNEVAGERAPPNGLEADRSQGFDQDGEMGLGEVDVERIEKVYR